MDDVDLAAVGALIGHPSRTAMLDALLGGRAMTATELARIAGVSPATASEHLARLSDGGMVEVVAQGRHRYHRIATSDVAAVLEALAHIAPPKRATTLRQSRRARSLAEARTCYDHLAGRSGVALHDGVVARGWLVPEAGGYALTGAGRDGLLRWGVDVSGADAAKRAFARPCLDWSERREHLAGALAAAIATALVDGPEPWFVRRADDHRGLRPTELGRARLADLGWEPVADRRTA
ncbi:MAG: helix-turn-helix domain-containing protein [Nocardioides sp.]